jgi:signal transduction histidine kinase
VAALSRASRGAEMRVTLPRTEVRDAVAPVRGLKLDVAQPKGTISSGQRFDPPRPALGTIVIAEDDPGLAEGVARLLSEKYTVIVGLDGNAAFELLKEHKPQLLITDIDMPGMNGIELAKRFREHTGDTLAPIIILSAVIDLGTRVAGLEAGAIDYVMKPFDPRELTARVDAQFRMRDLAIRVHQAEQLSTLGIMTSGLAHELRNPANGIVNAIAPLTELLPKELIAPDTGPGQLLEVIASCADQIGFLSKQLLGFRGEAQLQMSKAKLSDIIDRAINVSRAAAKGAELRMKLGPDGELECSAPLIIQALTNLIENGAHAAGPKGWVEVTTWTEGGRVAVEVADSGPGVPLGLRDRIFEPFFTTKAPGSGTGLGLPFARAILHRHGGTLQVRERQGRSGFVLELPAERLGESPRSRYAEPTLRS